MSAVQFSAMTPEQRVSAMGNLAIVTEATSAGTPEQQAAAISLMGNIWCVQAGFVPPDPPPEPEVEGARSVSRKR